MNSTQDLYLLSSLFDALINSDSFSPLGRLLFHSSVSSHPASTNSVRHSSQKHFKSSPYVANPFVSKEIWNIFLLENCKEYQIDKDNKSGWKLLLETLNDGSIVAVRNLIENLDSTKNSIKTLNPIVLETTVISLLYIRYFAEPWMSKLLSPSSKSTSQIMNSFSTHPTPRLKELLDSVILKLKHERLQGLQYPKFWASVFTNCDLRFYDVEVTDPLRNTTTLHPFSLFWNGILELIRISQLIRQNYIPNVLYTYPASSNGSETRLSTDSKRTIPPEKLSALINESISVMISPYSDQLSNKIKQLNLSIISNFGIHMPLSWFHPKLLDYSMSTVKRIVPPASNSNLKLSVQDLQILYDAFFVLSCWIRRRNRNDDDNPVERYLGYSGRIINLLNHSTQNSNHTKDYESILAKLATSNFIGLSYVIAPLPTSPPSPSPIANPKSTLVSFSTSLLAKLCKSPYSLSIMNSEYYFPTLSHLLQFFSSETVKSVLSALLTSWDAALPDQTDLNVIRLGQNPELEIPELAIRWYQCFQYAWKKRIEDNSHVKSKQNGHSELEIWFHNVGLHRFLL
ncbi:hypothetical protein BKA69DRAFT_386953 [Paraphysoderma sedebokerense]|nr:hypothetical protein BKA69DRAFT_386953 [Paraphysoderma sedebokerense]